MTEQWRPIKGYEGLYDVSSFGRVRTWCGRGGARGTSLPIPKLRTLVPFGAKKQYRSVILYKGGTEKLRLVHQLVAEEFIGPRPPGMEVAHDDGIGHHNWVENLEWKTRKANHADKKRHGTHLIGERVSGVKLTETQVREIIREGFGAGTSAIGRRYGVTPTTIHFIKINRTWKHIERRT